MVKVVMHHCIIRSNITMATVSALTERSLVDIRLCLLPSTGSSESALHF